MEAAKAALKDCVALTANEATKNSPNKTGNNADSIDWKVGPDSDPELGELQGAVYSTSGYGGYLETGTGIYGPRATPITPVNAKILAWQDKAGVWHYAKEVRGIPARPYIKPAADHNFTEQKFSDRMKVHLEKGA